MIRESYFPYALEEAMAGTRFIIDVLEITQCALPINGLSRYLKFSGHKFFAENLLSGLVELCPGVLNLPRDSRVFSQHTIEAIRFSNLRYASGLSEELAISQSRNMSIKKADSGTLGTSYDKLIELCASSCGRIMEITNDYLDFLTQIEIGKERVNFPYYVVKLFNQILENFSVNIQLIAAQKDFLRLPAENRQKLTNFIFFNADNFSDEDFSLAQLETDIILGKKSFCFPVLLVDFAYRYSLA